MIKDNANLYSHMFFSNISQLFSSHPPLEKRIKRIDKNWDETYDFDFLNKNDINKSYTDNINEDKSINKNSELILASIASINMLNDNTINLAKKEIATIPNEIKKEIDSSFGSLCVILSFIVNKNPKLAGNDFDIIEEVYGIKTVSKIRQLWMSSKNMNQQEILIGVELLIPKLMDLSKTQYITLKSTFDKIIKNDGKLSYFEWLIEKLIISKLDITFKLKKIVKIKYTNINKFKNEIAMLLSILVNIEKNNNTLSKSLFLIASSTCDLKDIKYINSEEHKFDKLNMAMEKLRKADDNILKKILSSLVEAYKIDDVISINEYYLLKTLSINFNIPFPLIK